MTAVRAEGGNAEAVQANLATDAGTLLSRLLSPPSREDSTFWWQMPASEKGAPSKITMKRFRTDSLEQRSNMENTIQQKNKNLVLEAFDTLFNKRDYAKAETFWSPHYIQHSAHIEPGREGLFNLIRSIPATLKYEPGVIVADGDFVMLHGRFSGMGLPVNWIAADILRIENGILVEHWDVIQDEASEEQSKSKAPMFGASFPVYSKAEKTVG